MSRQSDESGCLILVTILLFALPVLFFIGTMIVTTIIVSVTAIGFNFADKLKNLTAGGPES